MRVTCPYCKGEMEEPKGRELLIDDLKELYDQHRLACLFYRSLLTQKPIVRQLALVNLLFWYVQDHPAPEMMVPRSPANALMKIVASIIARLRDPTEDRTTRPRMVKGQIVEVEIRNKRGAGRSPDDRRSDHDAKLSEGLRSTFSRSSPLDLVKAKSG
jgi:hypothetical protein